MNVPKVPHCGRHPQRFRVTLEGVTRYVADHLESADVTLFIPGGAASSSGPDIRLGGMPLEGVEWLAPLPCIGDTVTTDGAASLPSNSIVARRNGGLPLFRRRDGKWLMSGTIEATDTSSFDAWGDVELLRIGRPS